MGILIIKRSNSTPNLFRDFLVDSIDTGAGDEVILCSGFFQENRRNNYRASQEKNLATVMMRNNVKATVVGVYNYGWSRSYNNFVTSLRNAGIQVIPINKTSKRWHAKVFILKSNGNGIFGIIGSSNITRPAFSTHQTFNVECDVILWDDSYKIFFDLVKNNISNVDIFNYINANYEGNLNSGVSIKERLNRLEKEILSESEE